MNPSGQHRLRRTPLSALLVAVALAVVGCGDSDEGSEGGAGSVPSATGGEQPPVSTVVGLGQAHVEGTVDYPLRPPIGGDHNARWQNCGVYREPIVDENAVHSLEHGAVWITYRPDLAESDVATVEALASGQTHVLVSPYPNLTRPLVVTAWGAQQGFDSADDPGLTDFIREFQQGPQTPELGAPCIGGVGTPV